MEEYKRQFVLNVLAYAVQRDVSPAELCRLAGLNLAALKKGTAEVITPKQINDLWLNAIHLTNDPAFGLHFGESLQLSALGVVGQIIQSSKTVGEALTHAAQAIQLITDVFSMTVGKMGKRISIQFLQNKNAKVDQIVIQQLMEFFIVFTIQELDGLMLEKIVPLKGRFPMNKDVAIAEYERVLRCRPQYKKDECVFEFDGRYWDEPILTANYDLQRMMLEHVSQQTSLSSKEISVSERVLNYLNANAYLGIASLEDIAANFNLSPRTLQRKLQDEGVSFHSSRIQSGNPLRCITCNPGIYP